uniref:Uncharacterized protein n=1 Tax=Paramoeba aestuarina TaxID=180227 RepID=A0A7S4PKY9_9EUKA|mmetsp:Transcript_8185/g.12379  ORF Transcript_8185/g.12379 Transcript_8185/m.12379 type:complete len:167 (+) Transcript_8185:135-635(+)
MTGHMMKDIIGSITSQFGETPFEEMPKSFKESKQEDYWEESFPSSGMSYMGFSMSDGYCHNNIGYASYWKLCKRVWEKYLTMLEGEQEKKKWRGKAEKRVMKKMFKIGYGAEALGAHLDYDWCHSWEYAHLTPCCDLIHEEFKRSLKQKKEEKEKQKQKQQKDDEK